MPVILDTCALIWLAEGSSRFSRAARKRIEESPLLYAPAISGFEIAHKMYEGGLELSAPPDEWFTRLIAKYGLTEMPLDLRTCLRAAALPNIHRDPCDRFIIAAAKIHGCEVVTADERFGEYGVITLI